MIGHFLQRSREAPENAALEFADSVVTYGQLASEGARIAAALARLGVEHKRLTAVLAQRSLSAYAGFLGTQMAGHTFVPLNPAFPARALGRMQRITGARTLVVGQEGIDVLSELIDLCPDITAVVLPENADRPGNLRAFEKRGGTVMTRADLNRGELTRPSLLLSGRPVYLMFTSGSAGAPKAVAISTEAATAWLESMRAGYDLGSGDRASHITPLDFDCALLELLLPLSFGACVCVPDHRERFNLGSYIAERRLTAWVSSPSTAVLMQRIGVLHQGVFPHLRYTIFGSEGLPVELARTWLRAAPNSIVDNVYGPTELTVCCTAYRVDPATVAALADNGLVPIGQPLPGMRALVVDAELHEVIPGEVGELLMTGPQVAEGYWREPELSRHAFVTPPSETETFYRTRDRVRRPIPGNPLTFLGRLDDQFKINGIRVEPGEIEASLRQAAGCDAAVALGWPAGESSAIGVVAFVEAQDVNEATLVQSLRAELPRHMVPRRVIAVSSLPHTQREARSPSVSESGGEALLRQTLVDLHLRLETLLMNARPNPADDGRRHQRSRARSTQSHQPTLWHAFAATVRRHPHDPVIIRGAQTTTFAGLWDESQRWAIVLAQHGVSAGDRVLLWDEGSEAFAATAFGAWMLGAIPVPLDVRSAPAHVDHAVALVEPRVAMCSGDGFPAGTNTLPVIEAGEVRKLARSGPAAVGSPPLPTDPALIVFTSGSTGRPKGVVLQHGALLRCQQRLAVLYDQQPSDRSFCPLPWAYTFALRQLWTSALVGSSIILPEARTAVGTCAAVLEHRPTFFAAIPPSYAALLHGLAPLRQVDLSCVRGVATAGSPMPSALLGDVMDWFANARVFISYGSTETQRSTLLNPALVRQHSTSVGQPLPGVGIAILDESGKAVGPGEVGEIVHRGDQLSAGYWRDPEATARLLRPDPFSPVECINRPLAAFCGDLGLLDDDGKLYLKGRRDQQLKPLGVRVSPQEIEELIHRSGLVREVGIIGRPHDVLGDEICAAVVPRYVSPDFRTLLLKYAHEAMSPYMVPRQVIVADVLPRTGMGKIDYEALRAEFARVSQSVPGQPETTPSIDPLRDDGEYA